MFVKFERSLLKAMQAVGDVFGAIPAAGWWVLLAVALVGLGWAVMVWRWRVVTKLISIIDCVNEYVGRFAAWLILFLVLATFVSVIARYAFTLGAIWVADVIQWPHGAAFMLGAGYTLLYQEHVRVDIFYSKASDKTKAWTDIMGTLLFMLPWLLLIAWVMLPAVSFSWKFLESSSNVGGLHGRYLFKSTALLFSLFLTAQGLAMLGRSVLIVCNRSDLVEERACTPVQG